VSLPFQHEYPVTLTPRKQHPTNQQVRLDVLKAFKQTRRWAVYNSRAAPRMANRAMRQGPVRAMLEDDGGST